MSERCGHFGSPFIHSEVRYHESCGRKGIWGKPTALAGCSELRVGWCGEGDGGGVPGEPLEQQVDRHLYLQRES